MYEATREAHEFVADDRDEAIEKASHFFGVAADSLEIAELPPGAVYGAGGRAVIVAFPRGARPRPAERSERGRDGGRDGDRDRGRDRERGGRGRDRGDRGGRGDRGDRGDRGGRERGRGRGDRGGRRDPSPREFSADDDDRPARAPAAPAEPTVGTIRGELGEIGTFVHGLLERMDLGPFEISESADGDLRAIEVKGAAAAALVGGDSRAADAIGLLANQAAMRSDPERPQRVVVDVEGNAEAREQLLTKLAGRLAGRARQTGRAVAADPMNGRDRRIIHLALRDEDGIATMSVGDSRYRQVLVVPEGAEEYEAALQSAEGAARADDE